ncbi:sigma-54-dependent transcriptional regulator [Desulfatirhabdium butyrativorans]|uniref:sigma-54-dependent transcriptional regulator n=1 Tax=Desulfatirhabdium butyrativorans TaxID=340467 RepID=UPI00040CD0BC|nr:sigma-54 dependent transcriptional regulator [Desulfatirhabdium butyrativorans]
MKPSLLIVDDEKDMLKLLQRSIRADIDCEIFSATDALSGLHIVETHSIDVALLDIRMPRVDGLELLERIRSIDSFITVIMMTAYGVIEVAVDSIKKGAYDFITKPFEHETLIHLLTKAFERSRLLRENRHLQRRIQTEQTFQNLVGMSPAMQKVYDTIQMVAQTDVTVLITGESGTGKNLAARAIHAMSSRSSKPYVHVNCPTLPESILESELFGYKKGAFTHATQDKKGLIEEADGGTLCLDEIGDISPAVQTKLLQVLEEKQIKPLGQTASLHVNIRLLASTNCDLREKIAAKQFREDLFYRLNVVNLHMPPLRDRREDIPLLSHYFLKRYNTEFERDKKGFSPELIQLFLEARWEGNVRELANLVKRGVVLAPEDTIRPEDIGWSSSRSSSECPADRYLEMEYRVAKQKTLADFHNRYFENLLHRAEGNVTRAAQICGLERQHLQQILRKYDISAERFR